MKHYKRLNELFRFLVQQGIDVGDLQREKLCLYLDILEKGSVKQNLVSKNDIPHLSTRHFLPSIFLGTCLPPLNSQFLLDLGSGAGFPGVLIKILFPEIFVYLLDSSRKKTLFLQEVNETLHLGAEVVCDRCENYAKKVSGRYQAVVARAVARLHVLVDLSAPLLAPGGKLFAIKGMDFKEELDEIEGLGWRHRMHRPNKNWWEFESYLADKCVIELER